MKVWKFSLSVEHAGRRATINMPKGAKIVHIANWGGAWSVWAEVDPDAPLVERTFTVIPTGLMDVPESGVYLETIFAPGGFVWHVYEIVPQAVASGETRVRMVCKSCGESSTVSRDATVRWNEFLQKWVIDTIHDQPDCCDICNETEIEERPIS